MRFGKSPPDTKAAPVLDQGIVITGDVLVKLLGMKLLPVKVRLLVSSTKLASELGLDWWREDAERARGRARKRSKSKSAGHAVTRRRPDERNGSRDPS